MSVLATDDFNRANNADLGANWTPLSDGNTGGDNFTIVSNAAQAAVPNSVDACEGYTGTSWPNDHWSEATLAGVNASGVGAGVGPGVRTVAGTAATFDYYRAIANGSGWEVGIWLNGSFSSLGSGSGTTFANGDRVYLELQGSAWNIKKNTTAGVGGTSLGNGTNSSIAARNAGICHSTVDATATVDAWQGGDFVVIPVYPKPSYRDFPKVKLRYA